MIVHTDFLDHWKTQMLCDLLDDKCAPQYVIRLWSHCQNRKTNRFKIVDPRVTKAICMAPQDADLFHDSMISSGFLKIEGDEMVVHDWDTVNASLIANWENGKRGGRPKKKNPNKTHGLTQPKPKHNPSITDKSRVDKSSIEKERTEEIKDVLGSLSENRRKLITEWIEYKRDEKRKTYKIRGLKALITKLEKYSDLVVSVAINDAMSNQWEGLFPEKVEANKQQNVQAGRISISESRDPKDFTL